ncbi:F0F1 ATP synthase subunit delta [Bacteroides helcogenes]|uniref:ATP synthase subunit delta n=1 Tax=Bacteroides helcogenes (strain ATCC 35417 / DSM 20613 / JCM 6297 / CCUG 15421 / P 36-108) TaxID=693979 RepID=E6SV85_BACT6|nr:F0F1 ATP synthase subunit delta [Bacteroides helcogenes]ADV44451.1 ATP synthase F1 subcomplex delta subunit [Bacteroides helcogenes P 36-108]MDY5237101.1 F0F1 ATP synthase subunit delta [Bacteroides helcogenes]
MDIGIVSMRYAKALMEYAKSTGEEQTLYKELSMLSRSFEKHPDLRLALDNPILTVREKFSLICAAAVGDTTAGREFTRFITLVLRNRREAFLQYICLSFLELYRKDNRIGVAKLITAVPVSREVEERIRNSASSLLHAHMELQTEVDSTIEGGFIFDINDFRLDASIATQLKKVKQQFIDKNRRIV